MKIYQSCKSVLAIICLLPIATSAEMVTSRAPSVIEAPAPVAAPPPAPFSVTEGEAFVIPNSSTTTCSVDDEANDTGGIRNDVY